MPCSTHWLLFTGSCATRVQQGVHAWTHACMKAYRACSNTGSHRGKQLGSQHVQFSQHVQVMSLLLTSSTLALARKAMTGSGHRHTSVHGSSSCEHNSIGEETFRNNGNRASKCPTMTERPRNLLEDRADIYYIHRTFISKGRTRGHRYNWVSTAIVTRHMTLCVHYNHGCWCLAQDLMYTVPCWVWENASLKCSTV